jgi:hypothetical protein
MIDADDMGGEPDGLFGLIARTDMALAVLLNELAAALDKGLAEPTGAGAALKAANSMALLCGFRSGQVAGLAGPDACCFEHLPSDLQRDAQAMLLGALDRVRVKALGEANGAAVAVDATGSRADLLGLYPQRVVPLTGAEPAWPAIAGPVKH